MTALEKWAITEYVGWLGVVRRQFYRPTRYAAKKFWRNAWVMLLEAENQLVRRIGDMSITRHTGRDFKFDSWVNVRLQDEHKAELEHLAEDVDIEGLVAWVATMVYEGYSFSVSWDDYSDSLQVSLVCKAPDDSNYGLGLSARHPDFDLALLSLRFKHEEILEQEWTGAPPTPRANSWS